MKIRYIFLFLLCALCSLDVVGMQQQQRRTPESPNGDFFMDTGIVERDSWKKPNPRLLYRVNSRKKLDNDLEPIKNELTAFVNFLKEDCSVNETFILKSCISFLEQRDNFILENWISNHYFFIETMLDEMKLGSDFKRFVTRYVKLLYNYYQSKK